MASQKNPKNQGNRSVIRSALSMAVGTFSSRILGFVRDAVMMALFPRQVTDCFVVAFKLPNLFRRLLGEGALSASFIPVYVDVKKRSPVKAERLASAIFTIVCALSIVISTACFVFMEPILNFLVNDPRGFASVPGKVEQTIYLARIMIFYLALVSTYAFHMALANTLGHFFIPAVGPTLFNLGLIIFTVIPYEVGAYAGSTQSLGVIVGGVMQMGIVFWLLMKEGHLPRFTLRWRSPEVALIFRNMVPGLFGLGVYQAMTVVNTKLAARLAEGAQSYIYLADRVLELPQSLIAVSLGAVLLPRFSELHSGGQRKEMLAEANQAVRMLLYLSLPAAVGMWTLSVPITEVLFRRGSFTLDDAIKTAEVVQIYGVLMLFSSWSRITAPAFYALKNTWLPAVVAFFVLFIHIAMGWYGVNNFGLQGLAAATAASSLLNIIILQLCFRYMIGPLGLRRIAGSVMRLVPGLVVLGTVCVYSYPILFNVVNLTGVPIWIANTVALALVMLVGMIAYFYATVWCGSEAAVKVSGILRRRFNR